MRVSVVYRHPSDRRPDHAGVTSIDDGSESCSPHHNSSRYAAHTQPHPPFFVAGRPCGFLSRAASRAMSCAATSGTSVPCSPFSCSGSTSTPSTPSSFPTIQVRYVVVYMYVVYDTKRHALRMMHTKAQRNIARSHVSILMDKFVRGTGAR